MSEKGELSEKIGKNVFVVDSVYSQMLNKGDKSDDKSITESSVNSSPRISSFNDFPNNPSEILNFDELRPSHGRKTSRRAVLKNGDCNILKSRIPRRRIRYIQDIFTTLVDSRWRWTLTVFTVSYVGSWIIFAIIWWLIAVAHGDLEEDHLPMHQDKTHWTPCVMNITGFASCLLFSIETQHTTGYGIKSPTEECPEAIFVMGLQSIAGVIIEAFVVGIVFTKMTRPKFRSQTLQFSRNAVICQRDGMLDLMLRVGDIQKSHIIGARVRAQLIQNKKTKEGELLPNFQIELSVSADSCYNNLFFIWPTTVIHRIDKDSPFYFLSAADMLQEKFEIIVFLEGIVESTGQTIQAKTSYLPKEVLWGHRFEPVVIYNKDRHGYEVNYSKFDNTVSVDTPLCSGADLEEIHKIQLELDSADLPKHRKVFREPVVFSCNKIQRAVSSEAFNLGRENILNR